jgi:hypothetical protein
MPTNQITKVPNRTLRAHSNNLRTHPRYQIRALGQSIWQVCFSVPAQEAKE